MGVCHDAECDGAGWDTGQDGRVDNVNILEPAQAAECVSLQCAGRRRHGQCSTCVKARPRPLDPFGKVQRQQPCFGETA